jgi:hypothetical protein
MFDFRNASFTIFTMRIQHGAKGIHLGTPRATMCKGRNLIQGGPTRRLFDMCFAARYCCQDRFKIAMCIV